jgi:threonyl-tRNA synthetase
MSVATHLRVLLPEGDSREVEPGTPAGDVLARWNPDRSKEFLAALWDERPIDLARPLSHDGRLAPLTFSDRAGRDILQHSSAHLVAKGLVEVIPEARPTHGPPTDEGFYYDFDVRPLTPVDLDAVRERMRASVAARESFRRREVSKDEARRIFSDNPYKLRYLADAPDDEPVSLYDTGGFTDLCRGPHVPDTGWLAGLHVLGTSAIVPDSPDARPLQRIRGIGFPTRVELDQYLKLRAEAEARDHRGIGTRQDLFFFVEEAPGCPVWMPKGMILVRQLEQYVTEHLRASGYSEIRTPLIFARSIYETSGHWDHYRENMFLSEIEGREFGWKPMNCPGSMLVFRSRARSYRELPLRLAEFAPLHRYEPSGTLSGLTRVREMVQDDAHIFVTEEQVGPEIRVLLAWVRDAMTTFRLGWSYELSTRPEKFLGEPAQWDRAEALLESLLKESKVDYKISPGEGAFYGPKIDIHLRDSLGRPWQCGTIQLDYQIPARFGLQYQGSDGQLHTPIVVHRTILGTWERFLGVFIEHCAGRFPPWLAPVQARILPVTTTQEEGARGIAEELRASGLRIEVTGAEESLGKRVRTAELDRIPYVLVVGDREISEGSVAVRIRGSKENRSMSRPEFLAYVRERIRNREYDP